MKCIIIETKIMLKDFKFKISENLDIEIILSQQETNKDYNSPPQLVHLDNIKMSIEFNKFLIDKYQYNDFNTNIKNKEVDVKTIKSLRTALVIFINWLTENDVDWKSEKLYKNEQPIYLYRNFLIEKIIEDKIIYDTATTYLGAVRQLYEWAISRGKIKKLPFNYQVNYNSSQHRNIISSKFSSTRQVISTNISIPKKYKKVKNKVLSAYSKDDYERLITSNYCKVDNRQIWIKLAKEYGLRRTEIANINEDILDESRKGLYIVVGKFKKQRELYFKNSMLEAIKNYCNSRNRKIALQKFYEQNGLNEIPPLFLNNQGKRISSTAISNIIYPVKNELEEVGYKFNKTFHDLRATYAVDRVMDLLNKGFDMEAIRVVVSDELGHSLFETTKKYLVTNSIRSSWSEKIGLHEILSDEGILDEFL